MCRAAVIWTYVCREPSWLLALGERVEAGSRGSQEGCVTVGAQEKGSLKPKAVMMEQVGSIDQHGQKEGWVLCVTKSMPD